jgi:hypothetical protein
MEVHDHTCSYTLFWSWSQSIPLRQLILLSYLLVKCLHPVDLSIQAFVCFLFPHICCMLNPFKPVGWIFLSKVVKNIKCSSLHIFLQLSLQPHSLALSASIHLPGFTPNHEWNRHIFNNLCDSAFKNWKPISVCRKQSLFKGSRELKFCSHHLVYFTCYSL